MSISGLFVLGLVINVKRPRCTLRLSIEYETLLAWGAKIYLKGFLWENKKVFIPVCLSICQAVCHLWNTLYKVRSMQFLRSMVNPQWYCRNYLFNQTKQVNVWLTVATVVDVVCTSSIFLILHIHVTLNTDLTVLFTQHQLLELELIVTLREVTFREMFKWCWQCELCLIKRLSLQNYPIAVYDLWLQPQTCDTWKGKKALKWV